MSPRSPRINADKMIRLLEKLGFILVRQSGSHRIYRNSTGKRVTVPFHKSKILHPKVVVSILRDAEISPDDFNRLIKS